MSLHSPKAQSLTVSAKKDSSGVPEADGGSDRFDDTVVAA